MTTTGSSVNHYCFGHAPLLVEIPSYIGAHRAAIRGGSLRCDGAGSPLALVGFSKGGKYTISSMENSFSSFGAFASYAGEKCLPSLRRGAAQASFPYYVIGKGKVDLYWSLGGAI